METSSSVGVWARDEGMAAYAAVRSRIIHGVYTEHGIYSYVVCFLRPQGLPVTHSAEGRCPQIFSLQL